MPHERRTTKTQEKFDQIIWRSGKTWGKSSNETTLCHNIFNLSQMLHLRFQTLFNLSAMLPARRELLRVLSNPIALILDDSASSHAFYCWNQLLINNSRLTVERRKGKLLLSLGKRLIAAGKGKRLRSFVV